MKKMIIAMLVAGFSAFGDTAFVTSVNAARGDFDAVMALLPAAPDQGGTNHVYEVAMKSSTNALAFIDSIPEGHISEYQRNTNKIKATPGGTARNALIKSLMTENPNKYLRFWGRFDCSEETIEDCIIFYETILKDVPLTEKTKPHLERIKGELLKLKGL